MSCGRHSQQDLPVEARARAAIAASLPVRDRFRIASERIVPLQPAVKKVWMDTLPPHLKAQLLLGKAVCVCAPSLEEEGVLNEVARARHFRLCGHCSGLEGGGELTFDNHRMAFRHDILSEQEVPAALQAKRVEMEVSGLLSKVKAVTDECSRLDDIYTTMILRRARRALNAPPDMGTLNYRHTGLLCPECGSMVNRKVATPTVSEEELCRCSSPDVRTAPAPGKERDEFEVRSCRRCMERDSTDAETKRKSAGNISQEHSNTQGNERDQPENSSPVSTDHLGTRVPRCSHCGNALLTTTDLPVTTLPGSGKTKEWEAFRLADEDVSVHSEGRTEMKKDTTDASIDEHISHKTKAALTSTQHSTNPPVSKLDDKVKEDQSRGYPTSTLPLIEQDPSPMGFRLISPTQSEQSDEQPGILEIEPLREAQALYPPKREFEKHSLQDPATSVGGTGGFDQDEFRLDVKNTSELLRAAPYGATEGGGFQWQRFSDSGSVEKRSDIVLTVPIKSTELTQPTEQGWRLHPAQPEHRTEVPNSEHSTASQAFKPIDPAETKAPTSHVPAVNQGSATQENEGTTSGQQESQQKEPRATEKDSDTVKQTESPPVKPNGEDQGRDEASSPPVSVDSQGQGHKSPTESAASSGEETGNKGSRAQTEDNLSESRTPSYSSVSQSSALSHQSRSNSEVVGVEQELSLSESVGRLSRDSLGSDAAVEDDDW